MSEIKELIERLEKRAEEDNGYAENSRAVVELLQPMFDRFDARNPPWNTYAVRTYLDHRNSMNRDKAYAADLREALALLRSLPAPTGR